MHSALTACVMEMGEEGGKETQVRVEKTGYNKVSKGDGLVIP